MPFLLVFRTHALQRMFQRRVSVQDVQDVLMAGEIIEDYPLDTPYPSRLVLGWASGRPLHVVAADNARDQETYIITVYEPDPALWPSDLRRRVLRCVICKNADVVPGTATVTLERDGVTLVVKSVAARVCPNCGEEYVDETAAARLLDVAERAAQAGVQIGVHEYVAA